MDTRWLRECMILIVFILTALVRFAFILIFASCTPFCIASLWTDIRGVNLADKSNSRIGFPMTNQRRLCEKLPSQSVTIDSTYPTSSLNVTISENFAIFFSSTTQ